MTADKDGAPIRKKTARSLLSDISFGLGALAAGASLAVPVLGWSSDATLFIGAAVLLLAFGSLGRSMAVKGWERRTPAWNPAFQEMEVKMAQHQERVDETLHSLAATFDDGTHEAQAAQEQLSKRFTRMENWVAQHAVPFVQNPEKALDGIIRDVMQDTSRKTQAVQNEVEALRRQSESAVRAFAAMPSTEEMNTWPGKFEQIETQIGEMTNKVAAADNGPMQEQVSDLRRTLRTVQDSHDASRERWRNMEHQYKALCERFDGLHIPSQSAIDGKLAEFHKTLEAELPDLDAHWDSVRGSIMSSWEERLAPVHEGLEARLEEAREAVRAELDAEWSAKLQHMQETMDAWMAAPQHPHPVPSPAHAIVETPSGRTPARRAHNPHPSEPEDVHARNIKGAKQRHKAQTKAPRAGGHHETKAEMRQRVQAAKQLVARARRR